VRRFSAEIVMKIRPLGDRIVVERFTAEEKSSGGIFLPDTAKNKPQKGKVLAVGPGTLLKDGSRRELQVKVGDVVLFTSWAGEEYRQQKTESNILLMREEDVLAVVEQ
jgi:chaperonin GroES